jgi:sodium transport system permease protein
MCVAESFENRSNQPCPGDAVVHRLIQTSHNARSRLLDLRQIWTLYHHEVRCALRERNIVVYSIVLPLVMYPTILWAVFAGMSFVQGQSDRLSSRVAVVDLPAVHQALEDSLTANDDIELSVWEGDRVEALRWISEGELDVLVEFTSPAASGEALPDNFGVTLSFSEARDRSETARGRVEDEVDSYRNAWVERARVDLRVNDREWSDFLVIRDNIASAEEVTRFILSLLVPMLILITVAVAAFYPAIDATAGERERSTWETLMTVAAPRSNVAAAKYLYVATFGMMGGLLNLFALTLSLQWILAPLAGEDAAALASSGIPPAAFVIIALGTALLGLFVAAGMIVFAAFARNFKEGQAMIMPFYLMLIMPAIFLQDPDMEFTTKLAAIPLANIVMLIRQAISGSYPLAQMTVSILSMTVTVALSVAFARWVMSNEEVLMGSQEGGLGSFLKRRFKAKKAGV